MPRAQDWFSLSRPGEGPLAVTLVGVLLINLTVLTVVIGFKDLQNHQPAASTPPPTPTPTPLTTSAPGQVKPATNASSSPHRPDTRTRPDQAWPDVQAPPPAAPPIVVEPPAALDPNPAQPVAQADVHARPEAGSEDETDDGPILFFGVPVE
ncbi:MAG: hypothetical protein AAGH88_04115 [Planctomycetota bacterium]